MLVNPKCAFVAWVVSIRLGCVGATMSFHGFARSMSMSSATVTMVAPKGSISW